MSIKTDAQTIRDETNAGANTATRVGTNLVAIADDLLAKQTAIASKQPILSEGAFVDGDKSKLDGIETGATADQTDAEIETAYNNQVGVVTQLDAEAGTSTTVYRWTPERVKQAISALGGGGGASVDDTAYAVSWNGVTSVAPSKNAIYDLIENQVFKVDSGSSVVPVFWSGTQTQYDTQFPSGAPSNYFSIITDGTTAPLGAADIVNTPSGNLTSTDVQSALNELQTDIDSFGSGTTNLSTTQSATNVIVTSDTGTDATIPLGNGTNAGVSLNDYTTAEKTKLSGIETGATADQLASEVPIADAGGIITATDVEGALQENRTAIDLNTAKNSYPTADATKVGFISITQAVDLDTLESDVATNNAKVGVTTEISSLVEDTTPQLGGELDLNGHSVGGAAQTATGDGATTIDWGNGNFFHFQFGAFNETFTFTDPANPGTFILKLVQDSVGSRTATWPASVKWPGGTAPTLTTTATTGTDIITFYFDGTNYFGVDALDFS